MSEIFFFTLAWICCRSKAIIEATESKGDGGAGFETLGSIKLDDVMNTCHFQQALLFKTLLRAQSHFILIVLPTELCMISKSCKNLAVHLFA